ncbi:MAG: bifunctional glutamate N-acetyltransferase/amino-acid acetyltransferase ArgJ [Actinomycetes bacterium]
MSITAPQGFLATGGAVGIKGGGRLDAALVAAGIPVATAAVFTQNKAPSAPVQVSRLHLAATRGQIRAVLLTSGNANAGTGAPGMTTANELCSLVAEGLECPSEEILICQTGLIGIPFPLDAARSGVADLGGSLGDGADAATLAATAIMTTDTFAKEVLVQGDGFTIGGMAKGAAMLAPDMATMLAVLTTDADLSPEALQRALTAAVGPSFNSLDVDGATSTNDTVIVMAGGAAGSVDEAEFTAALTKACMKLAEDMAFDAEGATKAVRVTVTGALSDNEAHKGARKIATSQLVKCSLNGEDPYWGRILSDIATAGIELDPDRLTIGYGGTVVSRGAVGVDHDHEAVAAHMAERWISIEIDLGLGDGRGAILTTDLGYGYIDENRTTS